MNTMIEPDSQRIWSRTLATRDRANVQPTGRAIRRSLLLVFALSAACTKSYMVSEVKTTPSSVPPGSLGRVAVVLAPPDFLDSYPTKIGANSYVYTNARDAFARAFQKKLRSVSSETTTLSAKGQTNGYDHILYVSLRVDTNNRVFGQTCALEFSVEARDAGGRIIAAHKAGKEQAYQTSGDKAFQLSAEGVFDAVVDAVLEDIAAARLKVVP